MAELKTKRTNASVEDFIDAVEIEQRKKDAFELLKVFQEVTGFEASMWGDSIIGFGEYHYEHERSTQKGDWPLTGFSPRKRNMTVYIMPGFSKYQGLLDKLGKHKTSVSCIYFTRLKNIDLDVLKEIITQSVADMKMMYQWKE